MCCVDFEFFSLICDLLRTPAPALLNVAVQNLLNRLLTVDLPGLMVLPQRLEISIPPSVTSIAEAAVGRDTIMRAVASAVLQVGGMRGRPWQMLLDMVVSARVCVVGGGWWDYDHEGCNSCYPAGGRVRFSWV